ncbi:hypothetical protein [Achromobacter denitrificans]|uniref:hypothetical protein n=1 Tax=Achromobacter denitrificans TaxID=32002 RepID=UPI001E4940FF|nr:hypothetical protein [Achromobacter denitrificans]
MTENNAAQPPLTNEQIEALAKKHIAPHADRLDAIMTNPVPYQQTEQFRRVKALIVDVLSNLRAPVADMYVEARECGACGHVGINDSSDTLAACKNCDWSGDSPKEDHCPGCAQNGTMTAACPKCGSQYSLLADCTIRAALASASVAGEACKRCGGPGWYTSHTTGYPESIPCSACNPQGVSVGRLEKDPFLAAQLWRKPANFADAYEGAREDLAIWKRRALEAESDLRAERETSSRLIAELNAQNGPTHKGEPAPQASAAPAAFPKDAVRSGRSGPDGVFIPASQASADAFPPIDPVQAHVAHCAGCETCDGWREMLGSQRQASEAVRYAGIAASVDQLVTAAKGMTKLYPHVWDRADGSLVVFPENVARFDAAFDALRIAVGEAVDDDGTAALSAQPGPQTEAPHDDQWTPDQLAAIESQGPAEPCNISLVPFTYPVPDEIADPCPQCVSGAVCKKPTCGRLIAQTSAQADVTLPPAPRDVAYAVRRIRSCDDEAAAQVALEHFADGHARTAVLAARQQRAGGVSPTLLASTHKGMRVDYRGLLHQARADLGRNSALAEMLRQLQVHLRELGQRWYTADTAVVDELLQLYCIESEARAALLARAGENNG